MIRARKSWESASSARVRSRIAAGRLVFDSAAARSTHAWLCSLHLAGYGKRIWNARATVPAEPTGTLGKISEHNFAHDLIFRNAAINGNRPVVANHKVFVGP